MLFRDLGPLDMKRLVDTKRCVDKKRRVEMELELGAVHMSSLERITPTLSVRDLRDPQRSGLS